MHVVIAGPASPGELSDLVGLEAPDCPVGLGGAPINLLARALVASGHDVTLVTASPGIAAPKTMVGPHLRIVAVPWRTRARERASDVFRVERRFLSQAIATSDGELVNAHWTYEYALSALSTRLPTVVTIHDAPLSVLRHHRDAYRALRYCMSMSVRMKQPALTAVSPHARARWAKEMIYRNALKAQVIPNIASAISIEVEPNPGQILIVATADPLKNVALGIRAFQMALSEAPHLSLRMVGPGLGPDSTMAKWVQRERIPRVTMVGPISAAETHREMAAAEILLHPSLEEAQSMALNEALAVGLPIIAGERSGGVPWSLGFGNAGLLVDVRDADQMARAILLLASSPSEVDRLRSNGLKLVAERYSSKKVAASYIRSYEMLLRK